VPEQQPFQRFVRAAPARRLQQLGRKRERRLHESTMGVRCQRELHRVRPRRAKRLQARVQPFA
jgi:hypothetical protein